MVEVYEGRVFVLPERSAMCVQCGRRKRAVVGWQCLGCKCDEHNGILEAIRLVQAGAGFPNEQ